LDASLPTHAPPTKFWKKVTIFSDMTES